MHANPYHFHILFQDVYQEIKQVFLSADLLIISTKSGTYENQIIKNNFVTKENHNYTRNSNKGYKRDKIFATSDLEAQIIRLEGASVSFNRI